MLIDHTRYLDAVEELENFQNSSISQATERRARLRTTDFRLLSGLLACIADRILLLCYHSSLAVPGARTVPCRPYRSLWMNAKPVNISV